MLKIRSDPDVLDALKSEIAAQRPAVRFDGALKVGVLELELDRDTAEFVLELIDRWRRDGKTIAVDRDVGKSQLRRDMYGGRFDRPRR